MSKLIFIIEEDDKAKSFRRVDTKQIIYLEDFEILRQMPVLFMKPKGTFPQAGVYSHYCSLDFNDMPQKANAVLLSKRHIVQDGMEIYAGQYCYL